MDLSRALDLSVYIQEVTLLAMAEKSFCQDSQTLLSSFLNSYLTARVLQFYLKKNKQFTIKSSAFSGNYVKMSLKESELVSLNYSYECMLHEIEVRITSCTYQCEKI